MKFLGNIIWFVFGGVFIALEYLISSLILFATIIGIPFGLQTLKLAMVALWPFGTSYEAKVNQPGCLSTFMNILWFFIGGIWISLSHIIFAILFYISIIGIPFANQHMKLAGLALTPFGREVLDKK